MLLGEWLHFSVISMDDVLSFMVDEDEITSGRATEIKNILTCNPIKDAAPLVEDVSILRVYVMW